MERMAPGQHIRPWLAPGSVAGLVAAALLLAVYAAFSPIGALIALVAATALMIGALRVDLALFALVATGPLESAFELSANPALSLTKLAGMLAFSSFALHTLRTRQVLRFDKSHVLLFALLGIALASSTFSRSFPNAATTTVRYASFVGLYVVVTNIADMRMLRRMVWVLSVASAIAATMAVERFVTGESLLARPTYGNPNDLAFVLATGLPLTLWLLQDAKGRLQQLLIALMASICAVSVLLAFSRGAVLALAVAAIWYAFAERRHIRLLIGATAAVAVVLLLTVTASGATFGNAVTAKSNIADYNVQTRLVAWESAVQLALDNPILGVGPGNFGLYYYELSGNPPGTEYVQVTHDAYLDVAAELGLIGLALFVGYLALVFRRLSWLRRHYVRSVGLAAFAQAAIITAIVGMLTHSNHYFMPIWLIGGMATAIFRSASSESSR